MASKKKKTNYIPLIVISSLLVIGAIAFSVISKVSSKVPKNEPGTIGNTPGNIYNGGLFCVDDGYVYFSNSYDHGSLYCMKEDGSDIKKLLSAKVQYINSGGDYLYYYMADSSTSTGLGFLRRVMGIYRIKKNGRSAVTLSRDPSLEMVLINDHIYFMDYDKQKGVHLKKISTDGKESSDISDSIINPAGVYSDVIYFTNNENNHFLMVLDTVNDSISEFKKINMWNPIRLGNYIYFMDIDNDYRLCRYSLNDEAIEILTRDRVDCYNLNTDYIYYQKNDPEEPCLKRMSIDGATEEIIANGNFTSLNLTENTLYFKPFTDENITYKTSAYGSINVTEFEEAKNAAFSE